MTEVENGVVFGALELVFEPKENSWPGAVALEVSCDDVVRAPNKSGAGLLTTSVFVVVTAPGFVKPANGDAVLDCVRSTEPRRGLG